jgi:predicted ABC-type ATPase
MRHVSSRTNRGEERRAESFQRRQRTSFEKRFFIRRSKIDRIREAQEHGFRVFLHYLDVRTPELAIRRVEMRIL